MANEIQCSFKHSATVYALVRNSIGQIWNTSSLAFEAYASASFANYSIALTEQGAGSSSYYAGNFPSAILAGVYYLTAKQQLAGSPAETDPTVAMGDLQWNGANALPLSDLVTSGQLGQLSPLRIARGTQVKNFPFYLVSSLDHVTPFTSGVVSGQVVRDPVSGSVFGALQSGLYSEIGAGWYSVQALTSGDLLANTAALLFSANGISGGSADPRCFSLILQKVSGSL